MDESIKDEQFSSSHNNSIDDIEMISLTDENLADLLITKYDYLDSCIANEKFDTQLCSNLVLLLKFILENGPHLDDDINHREQMNMFFTLFRNILRNHLKYLPDSINLLILRLIEIRASKWKIKSNIEEYYMKKVNKLQSNNNNNQNMFKTNNNRSNYHEKSSNIRMSKSYNDVINANNNDGSPPKNSKPLKMNTKGIYKDEVSIKNSDSGKVMGIKGRRIHMIEEMSDTIISFQKVSPTAKERLVLISGYNRENIEKAKNLIDVTIRQNISPIPIESHDASNFNLTMSSIKTSVTDPIENGTNFFNCSSSSNETNIEQKNSMKILNNKNNNLINNNIDDYSFSFNFNDENIQIKISDLIIGKKLQNFLNKFNFINFLINENDDNPRDNDKKILQKTNYDDDQKKTIITYDRDFLMSFRESSHFIDSRLINDIKKKQECLLR